MSIKRLQSELKQMSKDPNYFFSVFPVKDNFYKWDIVMIGPPDTVFEGALIKACIEFPNEYPNKAPQFKFVTSLYHPNVYPDGKVCISILHEGVDEFGYESISELVFYLCYLHQTLNHLQMLMHQIYGRIITMSTKK
jgi:ubiquitin-conjugating enzyme E2 G1